jgi:phage gp16-like protein
MTYDQAYPPQQRWAYAEQHIVISASLGWLETTQSRHIAATYGLPESAIVELKALKARFRNELSFSGGEK